MGLTQPQSVLVTLAIASCFAAVRLLGPRIGGVLGLSARATDSLAGGLAAASAFLGGAILLNVANDELAIDRHTSLGWFTTGLALNTTLLTLVTYLEQEPARVSRRRR
jgi:hypothetical protein